ncbi:MAG: helix-turn-helix transcriptional regulator [Anaerotignum sp.]|nr:helix-turn-helix transcriptional regulator [Anaerotignum sp.]
MDKNLIGGSTILMLLALLEEKDCYGYEIIRELKERSQNVFQFKEGTLYPVLHKMENLGYVKSYRAQAENGKERKYYRITAAGKAQLAEEKKQWEVFSTSVERVIGARGFA